MLLLVSSCLYCLKFKFLHCLTKQSLLWLQKLAAGIGLNVGNQKPTTCLDALLQELVPEAPRYQREELLAAFFVKFEDLFKTFINEGNLQKKSFVLEHLFVGICLYMLFSWCVLVSLNIQISTYNIWKPVFLYSSLKCHRDCISIWPLPFLSIYQFSSSMPYMSFFPFISFLAFLTWASGIDVLCSGMKAYLVNKRALEC